MGGHGGVASGQDQPSRTESAEPPGFLRHAIGLMTSTPRWLCHIGTFRFSQTCIYAITPHWRYVGEAVDEVRAVASSRGPTWGMMLKEITGMTPAQIVSYIALRRKGDDEAGHG